MKTIYNMAAYKSKEIKVEDNTLNLYLTRQNRNAYPEEDNNCGDDSSEVLIHDRKLDDIVTPDNTDTIS